MSRLFYEKTRRLRRVPARSDHSEDDVPLDAILTEDGDAITTEDGANLAQETA